ncbi:hypothetical protein PV04_05327 [Phialophora macrospora]|uniref:Uncharacterized protein n=1 Tax=Phialophora macrospora TaxID=1851006 RepID=A0A0D2FSD3_9EURO|nr:hypothetical protein PV04_05327 [Phialophora macrospora]
MAEAWHTKGNIKFHFNKDICPYVVIRHDEIIQQEDVDMMAQAVLLDGLSNDDRGCQECWDIVSSRKWMGRMPTVQEKLEYLYTSSTNQTGGGGVGDNEVNDEDAGLGGEADEAGESSGTKRRRGDEKDAAAEQEHDAEDEEIRIVGARALKKPRRGSTKRNNRVRKGGAMSSSSVFPAPPNLKSSFANRTATTPVPAVGEVIPPRPDQINQSESETYSISPVGDGRNWNPSTDKLFSKICQKSSGGWKRSTPVQDTLQAARRQMALELEANLNPRSVRASTAADGIVTGTRSSAGEGGAKKGSKSMGAPNPTKGRMSPVAARRADCVQCGHTSTVTRLDTNSNCGLLCVECSNGDEEDEKKLRPHQKSHNMRTSASADPVGESAESELADSDLGDDYESECDIDDNPRDEVSSSDISDSDASSRHRPDKSPGLSTDSSASESKPSRDEVTRLRRENARLRAQVAHLLDLNADASRREARLFRKLSRYEAGEQDECESQDDARVKDSEESKTKQ